MKHSLVLLGAIAALSLASCTSPKQVAPYDYGVAVGSAAYIGYTHIAAKQEADFRAKVAELWAKVDAIETTADLATTLDGIAGEMTALIKSEKLTEADRAALAAHANMVLSKVNAKILADAEAHPEAVEFLKGVRDGVDSLRALVKE